MPDERSADRLQPWRDRLAYGGDYNPEQWPEEVWAEDVRLMRVAGVNTATIGVFSWSMLEPAEGVYEFGWLDRVMDHLDEHGIRVILATPTASPPPWFTLAHPEALPVTSTGVRLIHGSRDTYNPAAPAYREAARRITRSLAQRYAGHPALAMWHIHNEYGTVSYGPVTDEAFRFWLRDRYATLESLNERWNTAFWSQRYGSWEEIFTPQATQYLPNPAHVLDFKRFSSDLLTTCLDDQVAILREATPDVPVTTNFMLPTWNHYDPWAFARRIDQVSIDHYLDDHGPAGDVHVAFGSDLARSFNEGQPWLLMEQATSLIYDYAGGRMRVKEPGRMRRNTLQYLARGATGSLFFQWRSPLVGAEFFHSAMVPHAGEDTRVFREVTELGADLSRLAELAEPPARGPVNDHRVAIVWHPDVWWAAETRAMPSSDVGFLDAVRRAHTALWNLGLNADVVNPDGDLSRYDLVLVPSMLAVADAQAAAFEAYVRSGGQLVVWHFAGSTDEHLRVRRGGYSGAFAPVLGVRVEEHVPLGSGETVILDDGSVAGAWTELVHLAGAESITGYGAGAHPVIPPGSPAITRHRYGAGAAHYLSTRLAADALERHLDRIRQEAGVTKVHDMAGRGLEVVRRHAGERSYLFALNHTPVPISPAFSGTDVLTGRNIQGPVEIPPGGVVVVREGDTSI
ncbi:beta-galactosidase [Phytoactinopolyspora alkaliphila]|uniref:Beta-galactosidase n=1 Tax=Phytoactinopolyspora alkaliphila TaxID=1783498 RepID=A0A6N9YI64_9ACTN|nr:beta-galactosidase [Phytoactinopolyspora alkaliphila]NED94610.1 beta-galactosidase [Phytoactinopolyspora alkaliphila]